MKKSKKQLHLAHPIYWPAWLGFGLMWSITRLPLRWQFKIGAAIGTLLYYFPTKLKHISQVNVRLCFPDWTQQQRDDLVKKNFASLGIGLVEAGMAWWLPDDKLNCMFRVNGLEHVEKAFARGKGIILLGPHFTCLEMIGRLLGMKYSFAVMYRPHKKRLVSFIQERFRTKHQVHYIARHRVRELIRSLEKNMAVWYAYDVDGGAKRSVFAPLFNVPAASLTSVTRLVQLSDTAVVPISFHRNDKEMIYEVTLSAPLENFPTDDLTKDATILNSHLEKAIREKPEQYLWQYKRFKTRPEGEKRFY
jgi:KDO2-lipid IV(A) lauroyltransferase